MRRVSLWLSLPLIAGAAALPVGIAALSGNQTAEAAQAVASDDRFDLSTPEGVALAESGGQWNGRVSRLDTSSGSPGAISFPPGTSYQAAVSQIFVAQRTGAWPPDAKLVAPLPRGTVVLKTAGTALVVDLVAPYGYDPSTRLVNPALLTVDGSLSLDDLADRWDASRGLWPKGAQVVAPDLPDCQIAASRAEPSGACPTTASFGRESLGPALP